MKANPLIIFIGILLLAIFVVLMDTILSGGEQTIVSVVAFVVASLLTLLLILWRLWKKDG